MRCQASWGQLLKFDNNIRKPTSKTRQRAVECVVKCRMNRCRALGLHNVVQKSPVYSLLVTPVTVSTHFRPGMRTVWISTAVAMCMAVG